MINLQEYQARRRRLARQLPEGAIALLAAASEHVRNGDAHYRFRQDSNFWYLTGFNEPDALLLIAAGDTGDSYLFNKPPNPAQEQWTGKRLGQEGACEVLGMTKAFSSTELAKRLPELLAGKSAVYYSIGRQRELDNLVIGTLNGLKNQVRQGVTAPHVLCDLEPLISEMRLFKSDDEIALMRHAAEISVAAHMRAMQTVANLDNEYQLEAELSYEFGRQGCRNTAYDSIIGGGANACVLHYTANNQPLRDGELVLIDAGAEFENYAADITRTFPVNGRFTKPQRQIYQLVAKAQRAGIACVRPGVAWNLVQETIVRILTEGLCELGILQGEIDALIISEAYKPFYMHNSGHWLGLDVHDCGSYKACGKWRELEPGMVLTVEPGLYIGENISEVDECWWNIGVRIEDDILVTKEGHDILSGALPVEIDDIEALTRG